MSRLHIKLCGFRTKEEVKKAAMLDIDALGFILVPGRKRTVERSSLGEMIKYVPDHLSTVGVFMNPSIDEIVDWLAAAPLSSIQLHGEETPALCQKIKSRFPKIRLIKTFHMEPHVVPAMLDPYLSIVDMGLLDATFAGQKGGTGKRFDWSQIPSFTSYARTRSFPLWIAGGITLQNVEELVTTYQPDGIDVSSGVEQDGVKDRAKMNRLIEKGRQK